jgi:hypothetical protein
VIFIPGNVHASSSVDNEVKYKWLIQVVVILQQQVLTLQGHQKANT